MSDEMREMFEENRQDESGSEDETSSTEPESDDVDELESAKERYEFVGAYAPDKQKSDLSSAFKRADWVLDDADVDVEKIRHFWPLVFEFGLQDVTDMDAEEMQAAFDDLAERYDDFTA